MDIYTVPSKVERVLLDVAAVVLINAQRSFDRPIAAIHSALSQI